MSNHSILTTLEKKGNNSKQNPLYCRKRMSQLFDNKMFEESPFNDIFKKSNFSDLPAQIFHPYKLMIMVALRRFGALDFPALRNGIRINSDGNLANHLRVLEDLEIIQYRKEFEGRKPKTFYELTDKGKNELQRLVFYFTDFIKDVGSYEST